METIENIVREMRDWWMRSDNEEADAVLTSFANRIEEACKALEADRDNWRRQALDEDARANATHKDSLVVGNAAAMYEALESIRDLLCHVDLRVDEDPERSKVFKIACAALAKPPRNCDRLLDSVTAIKSYQEETGLNKHQVPLWTAAQIYALIDWLFAEAKGDNK